MTDTPSPTPRQKIPRRYWLWLAVILIVLLGPSIYLGIAQQLASHLRPGVCVLGIGDICFMSGATFVGFWSLFAFAAILLHGPGLLIGAIALLIWFWKVRRYLPSEY